MSHVDDGTLHAYLDGELSPPEAQGLEAHVALCPACRTRLEEERALITRAGELLARAAPPDREVPPFRPGDLRPPVRLWWRARLPLAWAATIALALGIGTYVGGLSSRRVARKMSERPTEFADRVAQHAPPAARAPAADTSVAVARRRQVEYRTPRAQPSAPPAPSLLAEERQEKQGESAAARVNGHVVAKAYAPAPSAGKMVSVGAPISLDSARLLLGRDPLVVPDLPIRGLYRARMIGYSGMVIVEQALDSSTVIEVINGRAAPLQLGEVVVTGAGAVRADSLAAAAPKRESAPAAERQEANRIAPDFFADVRGPLSTDSLAALRRLLRPLRP